MHACLCVCVCSLAGDDPALTDLVRRRNELAVWLEQAENAVRSLPVTATDHNLKELKVRPSLSHCTVQEEEEEERRRSTCVNPDKSNTKTRLSNKLTEINPLLHSH